MATVPQSTLPSIRSFLNPATRPATRGEARSARHPLETIGAVAEVLELLTHAASIPPEHLPFLLALARAAAAHDCQTRGLEISDKELGALMPGDPKASEDSKAKRAQRARLAFLKWQEGTSWRLVTWDRGGGEDANGSHPMTAYDCPVLELAAELLAELPRGRGRGRTEQLKARAAELLERLESSEPTQRLRPGVRYPRGGARLLTARERAERALRAIERAASEDPDPAALLAWFRAEVDRLAGAAHPRHGGADGPPSVRSSLLENGPEAREAQGGGELERDDWPNFPPEDPPEWLELDEGTVVSEADGLDPDTLTTGHGVHPPTNNGAHLQSKTGAFAPEADPDPLAEAQRAGEAFAGAGAFFVVFVDDRAKAAGEPCERGARTLEREAFARDLARSLERAERERLSLCVRPAMPSAVQVDDCPEDLVRELAPYSFLVLETSPGSFQTWLELDAADDAEATATRARLFERLRSTGANKGAGGSVRWPGSRNWKPCRRQADGTHPMVRVVYRDPGRVVTAAELEAGGWLAEARAADAPPVLPLSPSRVRLQRGAPPEARGWPDYGLELDRVSRHPAGHAREGLPDRSAADFRWAYKALDRGWPADTVAAELERVSERAAALGRHYATRTAGRAAARLAARGN